MSEAELSLINKVELRIALAGSDEKFEANLKLYLAPLLLKLASPFPEVRQAILKIIQHLVQRISAAKAVKLPIEALLKQVKQPNIPTGADPSNVRLYSLIFVSRGVDRLSVQEQKELVPRIIDGISSFPRPVSARLFSILCKLISSWTVPMRGTPEANELRPFLELEKRPEDESFICTWFMRLFLLQPNPNAGNNQLSRGYHCPGLNERDCSFLTLDAGISYNTLQELVSVRNSILNFVSIGFKDSVLVVLFLVAACDNSSSISDKAETLFRKLIVNYEDDTLINTLANLFIGDSLSGTPPAPPKVQERILTVLVQSKKAASLESLPKISSIGLNSDYSKLKQNTIQFINWATRNSTGSSDTISSSNSEFSTGIAAQLKDNLMTEGWPKFHSEPGSNYNNALKYRRSQYEALGYVLRKTPQLIYDDFTYIEFLFGSLIGDIADLRSTIQDALSGLTIHLPKLSNACKETLKYTLKTYLSTGISDDIDPEGLNSCRYISIKYANCAFEFSDPDARLLCILGTSSKNRVDVIEEAQRGLHPHWFNILRASNTTDFKTTSELFGMGRQVEFPTFEAMITCLNNEIAIAKASESSTLRESIEFAINFCLSTLVMQAIQGKSTVVVMDEDWSTRLEKGVEFDDTVKGLLSREIKRLSSQDIEMDSEDEQISLQNPFVVFLQVILDEYIGKDMDGNVVSLHHGSDSIFGRFFNKVISLAPTVCVSPFVSELPRLLCKLDSSDIISDYDTTQLAKSIGIIASHFDNPDSNIISIVNSLLSDRTSNRISAVKFLTLGYLVSRMVFRERLDVLSSEVYESIFEYNLDCLKDARLYNIALESVGQMAMFGVLGPSINNDNPYIKYFADAIEEKVKKYDEKSVLVWSYLSLALKDREEELLNRFETMIYDTYQSKQVDYLFSSGESFTIVASGWDSTVLKRNIDIQDQTVKLIAQRDSARLETCLSKVLKACNSTKPSLRRAGCMWLLSFVQYCGHLAPVINRAPEIHVAFMRFLADRDEFVQDSASRGLSIVYEMGDLELKDTLVHGLLTSFTDSTSATKLNAGSVSGDTELFEPGVLRTNDGSVSTYKDVLNLASEVGDPSLVYKFMSLAKSSALWTSRKGIAFGLGSILSKSSLDKLLANNKVLSQRLIPKLFRYRFDPSSGVAKSMNDIWNSLIQDSTKTVIDNFEVILKELLSSMGNKEWRVRQASTTALSELLQVVPFETYEPRMEEIWNMSFRAMDDIKDSVRKEGTKLTRELASTLVRTIDTSTGSSQTKANRVLTQLLPFLLGTKGLLSDADEIKSFSLQTILKICKTSGTAIKPFIPDLIDQFIHLMSTLEPQAINYIALNADKYNLTTNDIDARRLQSVGNSPMIDAIEKMLDMIDSSLIKEVVAKVQSAIKKSIGLPSKAAGSRVVVSLVVKYMYIIGPYSDSLLKTCLSQISDRNDTIASSYATASGYLCRVASTKGLNDVANKIQSLYFESEVDKNRQIAAILSESVSKYSGDKFSSVASSFLPVAFIGQHDPLKEVSEPFEREWSENTAGRGAVKLYIREIVDFVGKHLESPSYLIRQVVAKSIANACKLIDGAEGIGMSADSLFSVLLAACKGRSWSGKEDVLEALVLLAISSKAFILKQSQDDELLEKINSVILVESKRRNKVYQKHAIKTFGKYLGSFPDDNLIEEYIEIISSMLSDGFYEDESSDEDMDKQATRSTNLKSSRKNILREEDRIKLLESLVGSFTIVENQINHSLFDFILQSFIDIFNSNTILISWRSKTSVCKGLLNIMNCFIKNEEAVKLSKDDLLLLRKVWSRLLQECGDAKEIENVRSQFIKSTGSIIDALSKLDGDDISIQSLNQDLVAQLKELHNNETSTVVKGEIERALNE